MDIDGEQIHAFFWCVVPLRSLLRAMIRVHGMKREIYILKKKTNPSLIF